MPYSLLADAVLLLHFAVLLFVLGGLLVVPLGVWRGWYWVRSFGFRLSHLAAIGFVVLQTWLGQHCPLTLWENSLRQQTGEAGQVGYGERSFIAHWLHRLMFFEAPLWVFGLAYSAFGLAVLWAWWRWPPQR